MMAHVQLTIGRLQTMPLPMPKAGSKDERGSVFAVCGSVDVPGAALLAGVAALRVGAGKLKIATVESVAVSLALAVPEAMVIGLPETADGGIDLVSARTRLLDGAQACDAILIGPGMTEGHATNALTNMLLEGRASSSLILDAAALCSLNLDADAARSCGGQLVITPHSGEMAQLLDRSRDEVDADPLDAALTAARQLRAVVVMKGAQSWIIDPDGERWLYEGGSIGLATSGSGDVLAGLIAGLLARGATAIQAALWGVYLHGESGARLAASVGPLGFLAREIHGEVPGILRDVMQDHAR